MPLEALQAEQPQDVQPVKAAPKPGKDHDSEDAGGQRDQGHGRTSSPMQREARAASGSPMQTGAMASTPADGAPDGQDGQPPAAPGSTSAGQPATAGPKQATDLGVPLAAENRSQSCDAAGMQLAADVDATQPVVGDTGDPAAAGRQQSAEPAAGSRRPSPAVEQGTAAVSAGGNSTGPREEDGVVVVENFGGGASAQFALQTGGHAPMDLLDQADYSSTDEVRQLRLRAGRPLHWG